MPTLSLSRGRTGPKTSAPVRAESDYSRFFEAGRDAAVIGESDAQASHGLVPRTPEERAAWDAGRASIGLNTLM